MPALILRSFSAAGIALALSITAPADAAETHACVEAAHEGQRLRDGGQLVGAREAFAACSVAACPDVVRTSCEQWSADLEPRIPSLVLGGRDLAGNDLADVRVSIDNRPLVRTTDGRAVVVDPGRHELVFETNGFPTVKQVVIAREGERMRAIIAVFGEKKPDVAPPPKPVETPRSVPRSRVPLYVAGGVAAVGLAGFAVFGVWGASDRGTLEDTCSAAQTCSPSAVSSARTKLVVADVSLAAGLIGAGVLAALLFWPTRATPTRTSLAVGSDGVGFRY